MTNPVYHHRDLDLAALEGPVMCILTAPGIDLTTISAKRVRKALLKDEKYAFLGLTAEILKTQRDDVDQVIARVFERVNQVASSSSNGETKRKRKDDNEGDGDRAVDEDEDEDVEEDVAASKPPKKKKSKKSVEESDAALARKLSTEINSRSRRGASTAVQNPRKAGKRKPKKSAETVDSAEEDGGGESKPKKRGAAKGGFAKEYTLSEPLSVVLAVEKLSRPQVVKKLWEYIRQHELQNPSNKKEIICDHALRAVFSVDKIDMFRMNKVLGQHLHEG